MENRGKELNLFLVRVFNEILRTEERDLAGRFPDLSLRELHLIEEVCRAEEETGVLVRALGHLAGFFQEKDRQNRPIRG